MSCLSIKVTNIIKQPLKISAASICDVTTGYELLYASDGKLLTSEGDSIYVKIKQDAN